MRGFTVNHIVLPPEGGGITNIEENEEEMGGDPTTYLAGTMAEEQLLGSSRCSNASDYSQAERVGGQDFKDWLPDTELLVKVYAEPIREVAEALLEKRRLTGDEVRQIVDRYLSKPHALSAGQKMNSEPLDLTQSIPLSEKLSTQSEEIGEDIHTQSAVVMEPREPEVEARLSEDLKPKSLTQPTPLSEKLSTQAKAESGLSEAEVIPLPCPEPKIEVADLSEDMGKLSTQSEVPLSTQPDRKLSTQSWASLSTQSAPKVVSASPGLSEKNSTQPDGLSEKLSTQPRPLNVVNLADFRPAVAIEYNSNTHKRSRVKPGHLIVRIDGYSIAEDEYGVCYLKVLSRKPDRTSADFSQYPYAGFFKWSVAEEMGMLVKEIGHGDTRTKSGSGRGKRRASNE